MNPFTDNPKNSLRGHREDVLLSKIRAWLGPTAPPSPTGMGDDCAVFPEGSLSPNLVTMDPVVYGRHFDDALSPRAVGAKLLKRNLSDLAAMGGWPSAALLGLFLPDNLSLDWLRQFYQGLAETAATWKVAVVGGDLCQTDGALGGYLTLWGHAKRPLTRAGAQLGDHLLVSGSLGGSLLGKHFEFVPRLAEGQWLAEQAVVRAGIDLSDGLLKDLPALLPPEGAAGLDRAELPVSQAAAQLAQGDRESAENRALGDGEDYELLFAVAGDADLEAFFNQWRKRFHTPLTRIGTIIQKTEETEKKSGPIEQTRLFDLATGEPLMSEGGYEHFKSP